MLNKISKFVVIFVILLGTYWNVSHYVTDRVLSHNMMESLMVGSAPLHNLGLPYKDYWGIYPPGIYLFMSFFDVAFQGSVLVFKILHIFLLISTLILFWKLTQRLFDKKYHLYTNLLVIILTFFYCSPEIIDTLFASVLLGNLLGLIGLWLVLFSEKKVLKYLLSSAIFTWAAMIKDPYEVLILVPLIAILIDSFKGKFLISQFIRNMFLAGIGVVSVLGIHIFYLVHYGVVSNYLEVFNFKREVFLKYPYYQNNFEGTVTFLQLFLKDTFLLGAVFLPLTLILIYLLARYSKVTKKINRNFYLCLVYGLLSFVTFKIQNRYGQTYTLQIIIPFFLLSSLMIVELVKSLKFKSYVFPAVICLLLVVVFIPDRKIVKGYVLNIPEGPKTFLTNMFYKNSDAQQVSADSRVVEILKSDNRVLDMYGWGTPNFFYQYKLRPFNRFFIVHPYLMSGDQNREWALSFAKELPKVVKYSFIGQDVNPEAFEGKTFQIKKIIDQCYTPVGNDIYILPSGHCDVLAKNPENFVNKDLLADFKRIADGK
jgi:hypothetical protein